MLNIQMKQTHVKQASSVPYLDHVALCTQVGGDLITDRVTVNCNAMVSHASAEQNRVMNSMAVNN